MAATQRRYTIGREANCDVPVADDSVSRLHAQITIIGPNRFLLADCRSSNGTMVIRNGVPRPVREEIVTSSDIVKFGEISLLMRDLLALLQQKYNIPDSELFPATRPAPPPIEEPVRGRSLVRCQCGSIKAKGEKCQMCGA